MEQENGIVLEELAVTGAEKTPAIINFSEGFNLITGASDTGKSYIVECIDYMLGRSTPPKKIEQSRGYEHVYLELKDKEGEVFTLQRSIKGGNFKIYFTNRSEINPDTDFKELSAKFNPNDDQNISTFILNKCGMKDIKIRSNKKGDLQNLSFRSINHLFIVDENRIIDQKSPIFKSGGFIHRTRDKNALNYLLTGVDDSSIINVNVKERDVKSLSSKIEVFEELKEDYQKEKDTVSKEIKDFESNEQTELNLDSLYEEIENKNQRIKEYDNQKSELRLRKQEVESRLLVLDELIKRFELLDTHYTSDIARLEFISEGKYLTSQLENYTCPVCEKPVEDHEFNKICESDNFEVVKQSIDQEKKKILNHQNDLKETLDTLRKEYSSKKKGLENTRSEISKIDTYLVQELNPSLKISKQKVSSFLNHREKKQQLKFLSEKINKLGKTINDLAKRTENKKEKIKGVDYQELDSTKISELNNYIKKRLEKWGFLSAADKIEFETEDYDLIIDGSKRQSHGKGVRALTHSAFNIGLQDYCVGKNKPHTHFTILDSPLTNYREEIYGENSLKFKKVENAFFKNLSKTSSNVQIIVFENKEPIVDIGKANYVQFTQNPDYGRYGFFPLK